MSWLKKKSKIESLKDKYTSLMKKSFDLSIKDADRSERLHRQADKLFHEIQYLS